MDNARLPSASGFIALRETVCDSCDSVEICVACPKCFKAVENTGDKCEWFRVYDIIEAVFLRFRKHDLERGLGGPSEGDAVQFADAITRSLSRRALAGSSSAARLLRGARKFLRTR